MSTQKSVMRKYLTIGVWLLFFTLALLVSRIAYRALIVFPQQNKQSTNNLFAICVAIHYYHDTYLAIPFAVVRDAKGKPLYSGRVWLLPFLGEEELFKKWHFDKAWDSPENAPLAAKYIKLFHSPNALTNHPCQCDYLFVTGPGTCFDLSLKKQIRFLDVTDGLMNTVWCIEVPNSTTSWAEPNDFDISVEPMPHKKSLGGVRTLFANMTVRVIPPTAPDDVLTKAATRAGEEANEFLQNVVPATPKISRKFRM